MRSMVDFLFPNALEDLVEDLSDIGLSEVGWSISCVLSSSVPETLVTQTSPEFCPFPTQDRVSIL
jgi:hypothetical protein